MATKNLYRIPHFIKAPTRRELMAKMVRTNLAFNKEFHYYQITQETDGFVAWFYMDLNEGK